MPGMDTETQTYFELMDELREARADLAFALAQGDGYAEDEAAVRVERIEAKLDAIEGRS